MAIVESKLKTGVLAFGGTTPIDFSCQATNVRLVPSHDSTGDEVETLCGDTLAADTKTTWALAGTSIQDFNDPQGFILWAFTNNLTNVPFTWQPNPTAGTWSGTVQVKALELGGDVNARLTSDWEFAITGQPTLTPA